MNTASLKEIETVFRASDLPRTEVVSLRPFLQEGSGIYVDAMTGLVTSQRRWNARDTVNYWSDKVFLSSDREDYGQLASSPFAVARLEYVGRFAQQFYQQRGFFPDSLCDFATGKGEMMGIAQRLFPKTRIIATEDSSVLKKELVGNGYEVIEGSLGNRSILFDNEVDLGYLTWTLCNCSNPLEVLEDVGRLIKKGGHLVVADSSRVLVPIKKSASDWLSSKHSADIHPFFFSFRNLIALLECAGFTPVQVNRYHDSDALVIIARNERYVDRSKQMTVDDSQAVLTFLNKVAELSPYFDSLREPSNYEVLGLGRHG